jgi:hypothetical protein
MMPNCCALEASLWWQFGPWPTVEMNVLVLVIVDARWGGAVMLLLSYCALEERLGGCAAGGSFWHLANAGR